MMELGARRDRCAETAESAQFYRLLNSVVIPRPIAWVSTRSAAGVDNLAPHSFFTVASVDAADRAVHLGRAQGLAEQRRGDRRVRRQPRPGLAVRADQRDRDPVPARHRASSTRSGSSASRAAASRRRGWPARRSRSNACCTRSSPSGTAGSCSAGSCTPRSTPTCSRTGARRPIGSRRWPGSGANEWSDARRDPQHHPDPVRRLARPLSTRR